MVMHVIIIIANSIKVIIDAIIIPKAFTKSISFFINVIDFNFRYIIITIIITIIEAFFNVLIPIIAINIIITSIFIIALIAVIRNFIFNYFILVFNFISY